MSGSRENTLDYLLAFAVLAAYGSFGVFVRWTGLEGHEQYLVFWRVLFGLVFGLGFVLVTGRWRELVPRHYILLLVASGVMWTFQSIATVKAIDLLPVSDALFIIYLAPVLIAVLAPLFLKEKLEKTTIVALAIALAGLAVIAFVQDQGAKPVNLAGVGYAVLSAVGYAALVIALKKMREKMPAITIFVCQSAVICLTLLPFAGFHLPPITAKGWGSLLVLGFFHSGVLALTYTYVAQKVKAQHLGVISYIDPVSSTFFAFILLSENPGWSIYVGGPLIIAAGLIVILRSRLFGKEPGEELADFPPEGGL